jgi:hypothetical protein
MDSTQATWLKEVPKTMENFKDLEFVMTITNFLQYGSDFLKNGIIVSRSVETIQRK